MEDGEGLSSSLGTNTEFSHCHCEDRDFTFTQRKQSPGDIFPQKFPIWTGRTFFGSTCLWSCVMRSSGMSAAIAALPYEIESTCRRRTFWSWVFFFLQEPKLCIERKRHSSGISPVAHLTVSACEGPDGTRCSCRSPEGPGANLNWAERTDSCLASPLFTLYLPPLQAARCLCSLCACKVCTFELRGMCTSARAPRNQGCSPVHFLFCRARCCSSLRVLSWLY